MNKNHGQNVEKNFQKTCDMEIFKIVTEHFRQDVREYWTRANFFLLAQTALFSAFLAFYPSLVAEQTILVSFVPIFGLALSLLWFFVLRAAIFWIGNWRDQVMALSGEVDRFNCYVKVESNFVKSPLKSPSYLTQFMPLLFGTAWIIMMIIVLVNAFLL